MYSRIISVGSYQPDNIVTNEELERKVDTSDEWIRSRTGIESRAIAKPDQATSDLAILAADAAIKKSGITKDEIDLIIVGTCTPDVTTPNVGVIIQESLGLNSCPAFSVEAACSGFIYALNIANKFILSGVQVPTIIRSISSFVIPDFFIAASAARIARSEVA